MHKFGIYRGFSYFAFAKTINTDAIYVIRFEFSKFQQIDWASPYLFKNKTQIGAIYQTIDWEGLVKLTTQKANVWGTILATSPRLFWTNVFETLYGDAQSKLSDEKLLERFNTDWAMQMFCGVLLADNEMIRDNAFVSNVRTYLGKNINFEAFQKSMINHWKLEIPDRKVALMDATCYEVYIRYPTDVKLLWEACEWLWDKQIPQICKDNKLKTPRSKFKDQKVKHLNYSKLRKKS